MKVQRRLPENFKAEHLPFFKHNLEIDLPVARIQRIGGYCILFANGILVSRFKVQAQSLLYDARLSDNGGTLFLAKVFLKSLVSKKVSFLNLKKDTVTIINEWTNNYFHWFTEALPKLVVVMQSGINPIVLLPAEYKSEFQLRSLEILGINYQTFSGNVLIGKNIILPDRLAPFTAHYNPLVMTSLVALLKKPLSLRLNKGERIYVTRRYAEKRKVENESQVIRLMKELNFCILALEDFTLDEQVAIMHHAKILVSIHGAGLTNMIFCKPGTKILELSLQDETMDKCYFNLANAMGLKYFYQFCRSSGSVSDYHSSNLLVDEADLRNNLDNILNYKNA